MTVEQLELVERATLTKIGRVAAEVALVCFTCPKSIADMRCSDEQAAALLALGWRVVAEREESPSVPLHALVDKACSEPQFADLLNLTLKDLYQVVPNHLKDWLQ